MCNSALGLQMHLRLNYLSNSSNRQEVHRTQSNLRLAPRGSRGAGIFPAHFAKSRDRLWQVREGWRVNERTKTRNDWKKKTLVYTYFSLCIIESFGKSDAVLFTLHPRVFSFLETPSKLIHFTRQPCSLLNRRAWARWSEICNCLWIH